MGTGPTRVWVEVVTTQRVVELGLRSILESADAPFNIAVGAPHDGEPDVVLFDVIHLQHGDTTDLERWLKETATTVIAVDRTLRPELGARARELGVEWGIDLGISPEDLVQVIEEAATGHLEDSEVAQDWDADAYPGQAFGLSRRESDVLRLITVGRSNLEITDELFLSINSVKTYVRSAYRKIGVTNRAQAVMWGVQHGLAVPDLEDLGAHEKTMS